MVMITETYLTKLSLFHDEHWTPNGWTERRDCRNSDVDDKIQDFFVYKRGHASSHCMYLLTATRPSHCSCFKWIKTNLASLSLVRKPWSSGFKNWLHCTTSMLDWKDDDATVAGDHTLPLLLMRFDKKKPGWPPSLLTNRICHET